MHDKYNIFTEVTEQSVNIIVVSDINGAMVVVCEFLLESLLVPGSAAIFTEEELPHIIINTNDIKSLLTEETYGF